MHEQDKDEIRYCIDAAFRAYMDRDWVAINVGHTEDWCGFTIHSRSIVQSNEAYVTETEAALEGVELIDYEMLEIHYAFYGAVCVVPYVARLRGTRTRDNLIEIKLSQRVLDVYVRQDGNWRQVAGNISLHPDTLADPEGTVASLRRL